MTNFDEALAKLRSINEGLRGVSPQEPFKAAGVSMLVASLIVLAVSFL